MPPAAMSSTAVKWTDQLVLRFVTLYRDRPCLWQYDHPGYKCKASRTDALRTLVKEMDTEGFDMYACKMKIKNMRSYYCHKLRKIHCPSEETKPPDERYKPSLVWFPLVHSFLSKYVHYVNPQPMSPKKRSMEDELEDSVNDDDNYADYLEATGKFIEEAIPNPVHETKKYKRSRMIRDKETEFDVFSRSVAQHLNSLPLENALRLQHNIQNLVIEERLRCIRDAQALKDDEYYQD